MFIPIPVEAVKLTGSTSKAEAQAINDRLVAMANGRRDCQEKDIKLCYVTVIQERTASVAISHP